MREGTDNGAAVDMTLTYDLYFASRHYEHRYPVPNPATLDFLLDLGLHQARAILDLGCGNGRYALPLLDRGCGPLTGCDPSREALASFRQRLQRHPRRAEVRLVQGGVEALGPQDRFDAFLLLFGVLGLVGDRARRIETLREMRQRCLPGARLVFTVPSAWRRLPGAQLRAWWQGLRHRGPGGSARDIHFQRRIEGQDRDFLYHLYGAGELRQELADGGWQLLRLEAESLLPESLVCRRPWLARIDQALRPWLPASLGYGMRGVAVPGPLAP